MAELPMHCAVNHGDLRRVRELIDFGVNMNERNNCGETPLMVAARRGHREIFDLLFQYGAQINCGGHSDGWTLLHWVCYRNWVDQVRIILEKGGADLNTAANDGETPLIVAANEEHREIFDLLIQYGAQVNRGRDIDGWTPLHWACYRGWVYEVRLILEKGGADLNAAANDGETLLIVAVRRNRKEIFSLLIQYGAQVNWGRDIDGWTTLHWVCSNGWVDQVRIILEKGGVDLNAAANDGETPLIVAVRRNRTEIFSLLIQFGAQVNWGRDIDGWTPLHWACYSRWVDEVRIILEKGGADLNAESNDGYTPLGLAVKYHCTEIFILLFQYGATMDVDFALISKHSFLEIIFKDVNMCTQLIVNKFQCQILPSLYRDPDLAKKLPILKNFVLKDQQTLQIAKYVEYEVKSKKFCNVFNSQPIVLMLMCAQLLVSRQSIRKVSASSDLPLTKPRLN